MRSSFSRAKGVLGVDAQCLLKMRFRGSNFPFLQIEHSEISMSFEMVRIQLQCGLKFKRAAFRFPFNRLTTPRK